MYGRHGVFFFKFYKSKPVRLTLNVVFHGGKLYGFLSKMFFIFIFSFSASCIYVFVTLMAGYFFWFWHNKVEVVFLF